MKPRALILAAHGSREEPLVNVQVRSQAKKLLEAGCFDEVAVAFHQGEPSFSRVLDTIAARHVTVVPFMTSAGHYSRVVLPRELAKSARFKEVVLRITEPVGTHPGLARLVEERGRRVLDLRGLTGRETTLAVVGHGTRRHPGSRKSAETLARALRERGEFAEVIEAFLDEEPGVESIPRMAGRSHVLVIPFLVGAGSHATRDIPRRLGLVLPAGTELPFAASDGKRTLVCDRPIGADPGVLQIVLDLAAGSRRGAARGRAAGHATNPAPGRASRGTGAVYLVGAGPGDPGLITVRGREILRRADVVVHDRLVERELLREAHPGARIIDVGKKRGEKLCSQEGINALIVEEARRGNTVARLKGGDPFVFGRGWEELRACAAAGIPCTVVPGVSSATSVPAAAGIPVTLREVGRSFAVFTAEGADGTGLPADAIDAAAGIDTVVILMGRDKLGEIAARLIRAGRNPLEPAACIQEGTTSRERAAFGTLSDIADLADARGLEAPVVTVVGEVVRCAAIQATQGETALKLLKMHIQSERPSPVVSTAVKVAF
jgi:uroporphyrin-III C-methyltransferase